MSKQANPTRIGAFVVGAIALIVIVVLFFGSSNLFAQKELYVVYFEGSVNGLSVGSPVKLRGVKLGQVKRTSTLFDDEANFYIEVIIDTDVDIVLATGHLLEGDSQQEAMDFLVARGFRAQLASQSMLTGQLYIKVDYFEDEEPRFLGLKPNLVEIPSVPTAGETMRQELMTTLRRISAMPLDSIAHAMLSMIAHTDSILQAAEFEKTTAEFRTMLETMTTTVANLDGKTDPVVESMTSTSESVGRAVTRIDTLIGYIATLTIEDRDEMHQALKDLSAASRAIQSLADYLERNPSSIIWGKD